MNNLFVALLLTTFTGTIFYLVGIPFRKIWFKRDIRLVRLQMRITQLAFMVPFVYFALCLHARVYLPGIKSKINLFYHTPKIMRECATLGCLWVGAFLILLAYKLYRYYGWVKVCQGNIPEEDERIQALFTEICGQLGVSKVSLSRNDMVDMPCIAYYHGFNVILPLDCYTEKEAAIIFYHELCHYLNGDIYLKTISCIAVLLHVFNPAADAVMDELSLICEEYCDRMACLKGKGIFTKKEYYGMILNEVAEGKKRERYNLFMLADTIEDYERRVQCMKEYHVHGGIKKGAAVLLSACFLLGSSITALAAGDGVTGAYEAAADATDVRTEESVGIASTLSAEEVLEEFAKAHDLNPEDIVMMGEEGVEALGDSKLINWPGIPAGKTYMYSGMSQVAGDTVTVTTSGSPSSIRYQMGLEDPNMVMRYVEGSGSIKHDFSITINGTYYFFVTNLGSSSLDIQASLIR